MKIYVEGYRKVVNKEFALSLTDTFAIFRWGDSGLLFEHPAEMLRIFKSELVGNLCDACSGAEFIFSPLDNKLTNIVACGVAGCPLNYISEIVGRHAQLIGTILYGRYA